MKKLIAILLVALMAFGLFAACGGKDSGKKADADPTPEPDPLADLYGVWNLTGGEGEETQQVVAMMMAFGMTMTFTFEKDGKGSMDATYGEETQSTAFTYEAKDGKLIMTSENEEDGVSESDFRIEDGKLYITVDGEALIFTKK